MSEPRRDFRDACTALADERYSGNAAAGFRHLAFQLSFPTQGFSDEEAENETSIDRKGDLGFDAIRFDDDEHIVLIFQAKSSPSMGDSDVAANVAAFVSAPAKLLDDGWVAKAHPEIRVIANEFRTKTQTDAYQLECVFATASVVSDVARSTFTSLHQLPGIGASATVQVLGHDELEARYEKLMLNEYGPRTDVVFTGTNDQIHRPTSSEPVVYLTIPARKYVDSCKKYGMELFRYNPRLYLGANKVNSGIAATLKNDAERIYFHLLNNGVTAICDDITLNRVNDEEWGAQDR